MGITARATAILVSSIVTTALSLAGSYDAAAAQSPDLVVSAHGAARASQTEVTGFENQVAALWGAENVWTPSSRVWIQYEDDLGERSAVDFENGTVMVQLLVDADEDPHSDLVVNHMRQGVRNLILGDAEDPVEMVAVLSDRKKKNSSAQTLMKPVVEKQTYTVRQGETLDSVARRFRMSLDRLAELNGVDREMNLGTGRQLTVEKYGSHDLSQEYTRPSSTTNPLLLDQLRTKDGRPVSYDQVAGFADEVVEEDTVKAIPVLGADGVKRKAVTVQFNLAPNHLEIRARKFYPLVKESARRHDVEVALIMAMIHTESMFNPRARSSAPAYGLMQLVPGSGAREAYRKLYGKNKKPNSTYLYDPKNNIELGVAYFDILRNRYMKLIDDPASRTYCAVAAYNAGAANVGGAFAEKKSINLASSIINTMKPEEVYAHLVGEMAFEETRKYTQKVLTRRVVYSTWQ